MRIPLSHHNLRGILRSQMSLCRCCHNYWSSSAHRSAAPIHEAGASGTTYAIFKQRSLINVVDESIDVHLLIETSFG